MSNTKNKKTIKTVFKYILIIIASIILILGTIGFGYLININKNLNFDEKIIKQVNSSLHIFDNQNNEFSYKNSQKNKVKLNELPSYVPASFISIEDKNFYNHKGVNYKRILKAVYKNLKTHKATEGASTISQQLIKNTHLSSEKTYSRKIKEILLTKKMENKLSKEQILEAYLNAIYFGNKAYGLENASSIYFDKPAKNLEIEEVAVLAGMIKSPRTYSPIFNKDKCLKRRNLVLKEMFKDNVITKEEYNNCIKKDLKISKNINSHKNFYEQAVINEACEILNISEKDLALNGYYIFSYLDNKKQQVLDTAIKNDKFYHINTHNKKADSCSIILDNKTGGILAFGGKSDYDIVNMKRSPGSSIKPILVYAPALESGIISPISPILDEQTSFGSYNPKNVGSKYYGYISATESVEKSLNIPAIKIIKANGLNKSKQMATNAGIKFDKTDDNYAIALGGMTNGTTVKELVNSYIPFSNDGNFFEAKFINKICDKNGNVIYKHNINKKKIMSEETAYLMNEMLISGVKKGTSSRLNKLPYQIAGKTGTVGVKNTNLNTDVWSVAYTTDYTIGCWLGNSTGNKDFMLEGCNNGGTYCTSMLNNIFSNIYLENKPENFKIPSGIENVKLDSLELENNHKLLLADSNTPEIFITTANFNKKYAPKNIAKSFNELNAVNIEVKVVNDIPTISFNALPQVEYKLMRINDDEFKNIKVIKNKKGLVEIQDTSCLKGEFYTYYLEAVATNYGTNTKSKRIRSNSVKVYLNEEIIEDKIKNNNKKFFNLF